jgi:hypothetical protein
MPLSNVQRFWTLGGAMRRKEGLEHSFMGEFYLFEVVHGGKG